MFHRLTPGMFVTRTFDQDALIRNAKQVQREADTALATCNGELQPAFTWFYDAVMGDKNLLQALAYTYLSSRLDVMAASSLIGGGHKPLETQFGLVAADQSKEDEAGHLNFAANAIAAVPASSSLKTDGDGHRISADKAKEPLPSPSVPLRSGGGHVQRGTPKEDASPAAKPKFNPKPARGLDAIAMVQATVAKSLMDTVIVRDGRPIGDVSWVELIKLAETNEREARILRYIEGTVANARPGALVREVVREELLAEAVNHAGAVNVK